MGRNEVVNLNSPKAITLTSSKPAQRALLFVTSIVIASLLLLNFGTWGWNGWDRTTDVPFCSKPREFEWESLKPSEKLSWTPCFENGQQCARLQVPLDYTDPENKETAAIALIKIPANVSSTSAEYGGPILFNPGGPGGSGVNLIKSDGHLFREILGPHYDLIGFDPRGIGHTTPIVSVFGTNKLERARWDIQANTYNLVNETADAMDRLAARARLYNILVKDRNKHTAHYTSTAFVARDMLSITQAHGRDKLLYWGFSYGSILGITYASMFPDNVGRIVVDGVCDVDNYYKGLWSNNLRDTDSILTRVFAECATDKDHCPLYESTPGKVEARFNSIMSSLKTNPVPAHNGTHAAFIDYKTAHYRLFRALYEPYKNVKNVFQGLADLEKGNGTTFLTLTEPLEPEMDCKCNKSPESPIGEGKETMISVACSDAGPLKDDPKFWEELYQQLASQSIFANVWMEFPLRCIGYDIKPKWRFEGPIGANTSHPLLLIGNTGDPVTPLWNAHKMSNYFKDSVVLTQDSIGHCSISGKSLCTFKAVRNYFDKGELPAPGTTCNVSDLVFQETSNYSMVSELSEDDHRLMEAIQRLVDDLELSTFQL